MCLVKATFRQRQFLLLAQLRCQNFWRCWCSLILILQRNKRVAETTSPCPFLLSLLIWQRGLQDPEFKEIQQFLEN